MLKKLLLIFIVFFSAANFAFADTSTSLPMTFNTGNPAPFGMPTTTINIQGKAIPILFDTGDAKDGLALSSYALKNLHVNFTGKTICANALDGLHCTKVFIIPELKNR